MRAALLTVVSLVLLIAAVVAALGVVNARDDAAKAEERAASLRGEILAAPAGRVVVAEFPVLRVERAPEALIRPVVDRRLAIELAPVVASWPEPFCLDVHIDGRPVFNVGPDAMIPASVEKVITAAAVLSVISPEERLVTTVVTDGQVVEGQLEGDVWVIGGGDPLITTEEYSDAYRRQPQLRTSIEALADQLLALGIERIDGRLIADETRYDDVRYVETWPDRYRTQHNSGPLSALTLNDGFTQWDPRRSDAADPALHFVDGLRAELSERSIGVARGVAVEPAPPGLDVIATIESPPIVEIVQQMLRESDNNTAELLLKELALREGGVGSTEVGATIASRIVAELFPGETAPVVFDGSGLDRGNNVTCDLLTTLLDHFGPSSDLAEGLPVANQTGTLAHRYEDDPAAGRLFAKTGLLNNVNGLAGFVRTEGGMVTFAQLLNGIPLGGTLGTDVQDELVAVLLRHPGELDATDVWSDG